MMNYKRHAMMKAATTTMMVTEINLTDWGREAGAAVAD